LQQTDDSGALLEISRCEGEPAVDRIIDLSFLNNLCRIQFLHFYVILPTRQWSWMASFVMLLRKRRVHCRLYNLKIGSKRWLIEENMLHRSCMQMTSTVYILVPCSAQAHGSLFRS